MPDFVLLEHDHPGLHYDFMLEWNGVLRTWRLDRIPAEPAAFHVSSLSDHRLVYLDYEGPVSGNRGTVSQIDRGKFQVLSESETTLEIRLLGTRIHGTAILHSLACTGSQTDWNFAWSPDAPQH